MTETSIWEEVRHIIIKNDNASRLSDVYKLKNRYSGSRVQTKACRACGKKGHMSAAWTLPKDKLFCKFCDIKNLHNTSACIKKQKEEKEKKKRNNTGKMEKESKPQKSLERRTASEEKQKRDLSALKRNSAPASLHNSFVQVHMMGNFLSGTYSDSDKESYDTPLE